MQWQVDDARLDEQIAQTRVGGRAVAVRQAAGNPHAALRRHDPQGVGHLAGHRAMKRQDQLSLAVVVDRNLGIMVGHLQAAGHCRPIRRVRVKIKARQRNASHSQ
ncbi:hypothetical protein D3C75_1069060 [compost metagenome]